MINITDKQIDEALLKAYKKAGHNAYFGNGFEAGVKFALQHKQLVKNLTIPVVMPSNLKVKKCNADKCRVKDCSICKEYY